MCAVELDPWPIILRPAAVYRSLLRQLNFQCTTWDVRPPTAHTLKMENDANDLDG